MASYKDYYNGTFPMPGIQPPRQRAPIAQPRAGVAPPVQLGEQYGPPPTPAVNPYAPKTHQFIRSQNAMNNPIGAPTLFTPGQGVQQANPFAAMMGMFGGNQMPGYGYQMPPALGGQYQQGGGSAWDIGPTPKPNTLPDGRVRLSTGQYVNPSDRPAIGPDGGRGNAMPSSYGAPQYTGNPYLPRMF